MRSKVLKIGTVLLTCVCLISFMAVPVSAATDNVGYNNFYVWDVVSCDGVGSSLMGNIDSRSIDLLDLSSKNLWVNSIYISFDDGGPILDFTDVGQCWQTGLALNFSKAGSYEFDIAYRELEPYGAQLVYGRESLVDLEFIDMGGRTDTSGYYWYTAKIKVDISVPSDYYEIYILSEETADADSIHELIFCNVQYSSNDTQTIIDNQNQNASEIIENQNENTQAIIDAQQQATQEQTEEITHGWGGAENIDDSTANDFANAEAAANGGKTDEEIQEEVDNALNFDISVFDSTKVGKIHSLFDNVLDALGSSWQALFLLSLTLGLGAFLIGRRYG